MKPEPIIPACGSQAGEQEKIKPIRMKAFRTMGFLTAAFFAVVFCLMLTNCHDVNCLQDPRFTAEGKLKSSPDSSMTMELPSKVSFFMEASGSMNGLYRPGCQTEFRDDVFQIVSYYLSDADSVYTLCADNGKSGYRMQLQDFGRAIKSQGFNTMSATSITDMIKTVIAHTDTANNEVGVLISDMKYDPNGKDNINFQLGMYTTEVAHITAESNLSFSLVAAVSKYFDKQGSVVAEKSPYYYLIIGKTEYVAKVRDDISTMLMNNGTFADNIETGMAYQGPVYSIEKFKNCIKQNDHAITGIDPDDPCKLKLKLQLENYRWLLADEEAIKKAFTCKMLHGSTISIDSVAIDSVYKDEKSNLQRKITATIYLNVQNMQSHCDVIEWSFNPCAIDTAPGEIARFFGAQNWREFDKTYSIENFIAGMFRGAHLNSCSLKPNHILLSVHE